MRAQAIAALIFATTAQPAVAQIYPAATPVPRSTAPAVLRADAERREIETRFEIGFGDEMRGDWKAAVGEFTRILALQPREPQGSTAHYDLGLAYANLGRYDDAAREFAAAVGLDSGFLAAMANLVAVDLARGDLDDARRVADRYVALAPASARALYSRGIVALRNDDAQTASRDFGMLLRFNPAYALAHYDLALAEERLGRYAAAEDELKTAVTLSPAYARAWLALGAILLREGRRPEARAAFTRAVEDAAGDPALRNVAAALRDSL